MAYFNKNKIYRVRKMTNSLGEVAFKVEAAESWIAGFFGDWACYEKENPSVDEAIEQIKFLAKCRSVIDKVVYRTRYNKIK